MGNPTPLRAVRIPDGVWTAALAKADADGVTVSEIIRTCLMAWVDETLHIESA